MSAYKELLKLDLLAFKDWFSKQAITKFIIMVAYIAVLVAVGLGVYFWSRAFFGYIVEYESYGTLTALYVLRSSFLILIWLGILSSLISTVTFLLGSDKHFDLLLTFPISPLTLSMRATLKTALLTLTLLLISIFPLTLAYTGNLLGSILALVTILIITESVGSSLGFVLSLLIRRRGGVYWAVGSTLLILFTTWGLLRVAFPGELQLLPDIPIEQFNGIFANLPLIKYNWITGPLVDISLGQYDAGVPLFALSGLLFILFLMIQDALLIPCRQAQKLYTSSMLRIKTEVGKAQNLNLITKDLFSIWRNPKDMGYLVFLLSMVIAFFGLFTQGYLSRGIPERFRVDALAFAFGWLIFFSGTYLLRLAFPLLVNEGQTRWWFFTRPLSASKLIWAKISTSLLVTLPLVLLALVEWWILPFTLNLPFVWAMSFIGVLTLAVVVPSLGSISPDFSLAYQPDKASTTMMGLISIVFVSIMGLGGSYLISQALKGEIPQYLAINAYLSFGLVFAAVSWLSAHHYLKKFSLDI